MGGWVGGEGGGGGRLGGGDHVAEGRAKWGGGGKGWGQGREVLSLAAPEPWVSDRLRSGAADGLGMPPCVVSA